MPKTQKPLTAAKVRAVLRKAGHQAVKRYTTRIRGWYHYSPGYEVEVRSEAIHVRHVIGVSVMAKDDSAEKLTRYAADLTAAGIACEMDGHHVAVRGWSDA